MTPVYGVLNDDDPDPRLAQSLLRLYLGGSQICAGGAGVSCQCGGGQRRQWFETVGGRAAGCVDVVSLATERILAHAAMHWVCVGASSGKAYRGIVRWRFPCIRMYGMWYLWCIGKALGADLRVVRSISQ